MKVLGIVLVFLGVILVGECQDDHHVQSRILNTNNVNSATTLPSENLKTNNIKKDKKINETKISEDIEYTTHTPDPSTKLEQKLNDLASSSSPSNGKNNNTIESIDSHQLNVSEAFKNVSATYFNVSSLLRNSSPEAPDPNKSADKGPVSNTSIIGVPEVFPEGKSVNGTKVIEGNSDPEKLQILVSKENCTTKNLPDWKTVNFENMTESEQRDMMNRTLREKAKTYAPCLESQHKHPLEPEEPLQITDKKPIDDETENMEDEKQTEDQLRKHGKLDAGTSASEDDSDYQQRYLAAILVSSLVAVSVLCYASLLIWRRYLENRYGSRTMLVNEEEFDDPNDMRHFSI